MTSLPTMDGTERPVRVPKTAEVVAERIRARIVRGELTEGDTLPSEAELMAIMGVSRPTLREAFRILESESLISLRRGARDGARVHLPSPKVAARYAGLILQSQGATIADVWDARLLIEPPAVRKLAEQGSTRSLATLRKVLDDVRSAPDPVAFAHASVRFHMQIVELTGNKTLALVASLLTDIVDASHAAAMARKATERTGQDMARACKAYEKLIDLVAAGDGAGAEAFWRRHMMIAGRLLLEDIGETTVLDLLVG